MSANVKYIKQLVNYLLTQQSPEAMEEALHDLLTQNELVDVAKRLQILKMLEGNITQRQIVEELGVGIATVTRGSNVLKKRRTDR